MGWFSAFITANLIGIGSNLDNCGVGIAYGTGKVRFPHWVNAVVNLIGFCTALLGAYAGEVIARYLTANQASWLSCMVLVGIGLFFWYGAYIHPRISPNPQAVKVKRPGWKQGVMLGLALSFTNVASGFGATVSNALTIWVATASITVWGYLMIWLGNVIGIGILARLLGKYASFAAGLLLILVGMHQVLG
ncbi:MAG: manganese efflux pump [Alicyclobacillus sp.]|nr:manganese efflux pump [Alicyclobacillus sp.]